MGTLIGMATAKGEEFMPQQFVKRDGAVYPFREYKLELVFAALEVEDPGKVAAVTAARLTGKRVTAQQVEDAVLATCERLHLTEARQRYLDYKEHRAQEFAKQTDPTARLERLVKGDPTIIHENANKDSTVFSTRRDLTAGTVGKTLGLTMMPPHIAHAHLKGVIHFHDLDYSPLEPYSNCCLIDFETMFRDGFKIGNAEVERPKSIQTAVAQIVQVIASVASQQYGGCTVDHIDTLLAPYAMMNYAKHQHTAQKYISEKESQEQYARERTVKDIYDAMQSLEYEINTLFTTNGQTPFTSVGFGLGTSWASREIQRAILQVRIDGLGKNHRTAIFPKLLFAIKDGINHRPEDPNYDIKQLAIECATKRMYPDILNYPPIVAITGNFKSPMGCRSFLPKWTDEDGREVNDGRANMGVVTLNLPRIAMEAHGNQELFWTMLEDRLQLAHEALMVRVKRIRDDARPENAPILYKYGAFGMKAKDGESVDRFYNHDRATVSLGYIGLYEVGTAFFGPNWEHNETAHAFTVRVVRVLNEHCKRWAKESGYHFSVYSTPSESLTDRFCRLDTQRFGKVRDITDKEYYTNSFHYDVRKHPNPFEKLTFEMEYPHYATAGFIHYCEYPNLRQNPKALEAVWDWSYDKIGYLGTNTPIDKCYKCGFEGEFAATTRGFQCPDCGNHDPQTCDCVKRTCGYLGNPLQRPMVHGRHEEIAARVKHLSPTMAHEMASHAQSKQRDVRGGVADD